MKCVVEGCNLNHRNHKKYISDLRWKNTNRDKYLLGKKLEKQHHKEYYKNYIKNYQQTHRKEVNRNNSNYRKRHPERCLAYNIKRMSGISSVFNITRFEYKMALTNWYECIKKKYNYTCQWCGGNNDLRSHHILPKSCFPEESLDINNGFLLCQKCHIECHRLIGFTYGRNLLAI